MTEKIENLFKTIDEELNRLKKKNEEYRKEYETALEETLKNSILGKFEEEEIKSFLKEPYCILPRKVDEWYVIVPKFVNFAVGWLETTTDTYNVFIVSKFMNMVYQLPSEILDKIKFKPPLPLTVYDGMLLTGEEHQDTAWMRYKKHLSRREGSDRIRIKRGHAFQLIASIIQDGILPFKITPVLKEDLRRPKWGEEEIVLRDYQEKAWKKFLQTGAVGIFHPFGTGKTYLGLHAMANLKGKHLVVVPTRTLVEQWNKHIRHFIPDVDVTVETYASYHKVSDEDWDLIIFDEAHRLPANTYSRLSTIRTKYRIGLSATPYREDKRTDYIFSLTGFPIGLDWENMKKLGVIKPPDIRLYIFKHYQDKLRKLKELLSHRIDKTIIFCDSIQLGKKISTQYGIPHVYGATSNRLDIIKQSETTVVSRVGDEGLSVPRLRRVIELDFHGKSRRQEGQRAGRLFHGKVKGEHIILMTEVEYRKFNKRLYALYEKGFKVEVIR